MTQLSQTDAIKGNAADAMKAYINEVHMTLIQTLELLLNNYEMTLGKYVKGYLEVDSSESFKLVKEDFDAHVRNLSSHRSDFTSIGDKLKAISDEAEDILALGGAGSKRLFNVVSEMDSMKKTVSNLDDSWNKYENGYKEFDQVQDLIAQTKALLKSTLSVPRGYSYSPGSFSKLISKDFVNAFEANIKYAQNKDNQKEFKKDWDRICKDYTTDQKRMAEEEKEKAQEEGLIGLIWDELQIVGGTVITVVGLGLTPFTGGVSIGLVVLGGSMVVGGVNSAINHTSMAITGNGYNLVGNLTNEIGQWYNKSIGKSLGKTGAYGFVNGFVSGTGEMVSGMAQFSVYDTGKTVYTLCTNHEARAQVGTSIGNWWNQVRSGNTYVIGQTTAVAASVLVAPEDIGAATSDASKVDSLLGKIGTFSKSVAISSAENAKSLLTKVKGTVSDLGTASAAFAKAFGKTYVEESGKYVNTCFSASGAAGAGAEAIYKATKNGFKEAKNALQTVKVGENGFVDGVSKADLNAYLDAYRAELRVSERNTVAVGKTDVKGLEEYTFKGASPQVMKDAKKAGFEVKTIDEEFPNRSIKAPWDTHRRGYGQFTRHAEEGIMAQFEEAVNNAGILPEDVKGTIYIHQSNGNGVCPMCTKGLFEEVEPKGIFKQFTEKYPNLNIVVTSDIRAGGSNGIGSLTFNVKNGEVSNWTKK